MYCRSEHRFDTVSEEESQGTAVERGEHFDRCIREGLRFLLGLCCAWEDKSCCNEANNLCVGYKYLFIRGIHACSWRRGGLIKEAADPLTAQERFFYFVAAKIQFPLSRSRAQNRFSG